ncbi:MAG TPA: UDP-N-acetylmuramoyl-L-alanyl-D-glutamate--2,6-diaminopimelate ligase [Steroidobacteraceae bacterium]|nr:UDP-N-acetylmuramoyl-L-alanyl-D-glutamate--2,6-diaminopimelate ligase [Steroidobacteraceae bacterium]
MMAHDIVHKGVSLAELLSGIAAVQPDVLVTDITLDSRAVSAGGVFLACRGISSHGLRYLEPALAAGARVILWEPAPDIEAPRLPTGIVGLAVPDLRAHVGIIANRFFGAPSAQIRIAGFTGTNGKTTCCWLLAQALEASGRRAAYSGTLGVGSPSTLKRTTHTTPDCVSVHRELADLHGQGVRFLGMEVSSHALAQERVSGVHFHTAVFTNLSRDHLDYHKTMDAYAEVKARLLRWPDIRFRVINMGDAAGRRIAQMLSPEVPLTAVWTGVGGYRETSDTFVQARRVLASNGGLAVEFDSSWGAGRIHSRLIGDFNAENLIAVLAVLLLWEVPLREAVATLEAAAAPAGRMETFRGRPDQALVVVDYAHSPDALGKALRAARRHCRGRLWCVFGCGGDRDPGKRPMMGAIASELADELILTDDNPRTEDPQQIIDQIIKGIPSGEPVRVIRERARAIAAALAEAGPDDIVVIAGKGHEDYQLYGTTSQPFSDRAEVQRLLGGAA